MRRALVVRDCYVVFAVAFALTQTLSSGAKDTFEKNLEYVDDYDRRLESSREILQIDENVIVTSSREKLEQAFSSLQPNSRIILDFDEAVTLSRTIEIDVPGVSLEGGRKQLSVLRCPKSPNASSALTVRGVSASIKSVEFRGCRGQSAVSVETPGATGKDEFEVSFERVSFKKNGGRRQLIRGAAVRADACRAESCARLSLNFASCRFRNNLATYGGAIYLADGDLKISESEFVVNEADLNGGAVYVQRNHSTTITVQSSHFELNVAHNDQKLHLADEEELLATSNRTMTYVGMGGALFVMDAELVTISESNFINNTGCRGGGAVGAVHMTAPFALAVPPAINISHSLFQTNRGFCGHQPRSPTTTPTVYFRNAGGAMMYESADKTNSLLTVQRSKFVRNAAVTGGGLSVVSVMHSKTEHRMVSSSFVGNSAVSHGGNAFIARTRLAATSCNFTDARATYGAGIQLYKNGMFSVLRDPDNPSALSYFEGNTAVHNAGISADGRLDLTAVIVRNNTSFAFGGGIHNFLGRSLFRGVIVEDNRSFAGGGVTFARQRNITITSDDLGNPTIIRNNLAIVGGGVFFQSAFNAPFTMTVNNTIFEHNRALSSESPEILELVEQSDGFDPCREANVVYPNATEQLAGHSVIELLVDMPVGHGGGIAISLTSVKLFTVVEIIFQNVIISGNTARVGGGLSVFFTNMLWNKPEYNSCSSAANGLQVCQRFVFVNVTVTYNTANYAGGIFSTLPDGISVACSPTNQSRFDWLKACNSTSDDPLEPYCSRVANNSITDGNSVGPGVSTRAEYLEIEDTDGTALRLASGDRLSVPCRNDTSKPCPLRILVKDAFNQTIVTGIEDAQLELTLVSGTIHGALKYSARGGVAVIDSTFARGVNRTCNLTVVSERNSRVRIQIGLVVRPCLSGESERQDVCAQCQRDQYGFRPDLGCNPCETNAVCDGKAALVPASGYWHSNPFSPVFRRCVLPAACEYKNRHQNLTAFYQNDTKVTRALETLDAYLEGAGTRPEFPEYRQCTEGYEGILCGSCSLGYGHSFTGACEQCPGSRLAASLLLIFKIFWTVVLIGVNCGTTLSSMSTRVKVMRYDVHTRTQKRARALRKSDPFQMSSRMLASVVDQYVQDDAEEAGLSTTSRFEELLMMDKKLKATVQLTETFKVLMNYLQINAAALSLQTSWSGSLDSLLSVQAGFIGFTNELLSVPFECNLSVPSCSATLTAFWERLATPAVVLLALLSGFLFAWFASKFYQHAYNGRGETRNQQHTAQRLFTCLTVICIVTVYFSYIDLAKELLRTVNCVRIENAEEIIAADHNYIAYAIETGGRRVWAEDTKFVCFEGRHLAVGLVGVFGLVMLLAVIVLIVVWIPLNKQHATETEFIARYWFLYEAYRDEWYTRAWESTILTRKALIAAVVVFSAHLDPTLQAAMCSGILVVCLVLHNTFAPYKIPLNHEYVPDYAGSVWKKLRLPSLAHKWKEFNNRIHLNTLEAAALTGSILVFYCVMVLHDSEGSTLGHLSLGALAFGVNAVLSLYMFYRLYAGCHVLIDVKLELTNPNFLDTHRQGMDPISLLKKWISWIGGQWQELNNVSDQPGRLSMENF